MTSTKPKLPNRLSFNCYAVEGDFRKFAASVFEAIREAGLAEPVRWSTHGAEGKADVARAVDALPRTAAEAGKSPCYIEFDLTTGFGGMVQYFPDNRGQPTARAGLQWTSTKVVDREGDARKFQASCVSVCAALMGKFDVYSAELRPDSEGHCIPVVPLVNANSHIAVVTPGGVDQAYDEPDRFWAAGWSTVNESRGRRLLARDVEVLGGPEYLEKIIDPQWAMARAAKPGRTRYDQPTVRAEEAKIFNRGEGRLHAVGYSEAEQLLEYSCALERGQHIQGWEIYALLAIVKQGKSTEGWPVKTVRIVFLEKWMAEQEKRPLLDIGCHVWHYQDDGELREITE